MTTKLTIVLFTLGIFALALLISSIVVFGMLYGFTPAPSTFF